MTDAPHPPIVAKAPAIKPKQKIPAAKPPKNYDRAPTAKHAIVGYSAIKK